MASSERFSEPREKRMLVQVPVSWGEMLDKITILEIKSEQIKDAGKLMNIRRELEELCRTRDELIVMPDEVKAMVAELKHINQKLWVVEDDLRDCERKKDFGAKFVELARAVYYTNDERATIKREINDALGSALVEEKSYAAY
jgi:hypothetical protein